MQLTQNWYAVYTKSRAEKKVAKEFEFKNIEYYLPIQKQLRKWSDRKKWVEVPLISGYIFVHISNKEYDSVLKTEGVVAFVRFEGKAATIPNEQIENIKRLLQQHDIPIEINRDQINLGDKIEVIAGALVGIKGTLKSIKGKKKVCVQIEQLNISLTAEVPIAEIRIIK